MKESGFQFLGSSTLWIRDYVGKLRAARMLVKVFMQAWFRVIFSDEQSERT